jgi:hypothetical protein
MAKKHTAKKTPARQPRSSSVLPVKALAQPQESTQPERRKTCFVVMPIGDQNFGEHKVSAGDLRKKYTDLIREAVQAARNDIDVIRADDVVAGGGITNDIFERLMRSDYVIADISYPNPNVYYELGLRHACRGGTIPIRDRKSPFSAPFDVQDLRYIDYEDTSSGLKDLKTKLEQRLSWIDHNTSTPDNKFLEYAQFVKFQFPQYSQDTHSQTADVFMTFLQHPGLLEKLMDPTFSKDPRSMMGLMSQYPEASRSLIAFMIRQGKMPMPW